MQERDKQALGMLIKQLEHLLITFYGTGLDSVPPAYLNWLEPQPQS